MTISCKLPFKETVQQVCKLVDAIIAKQGRTAAAATADTDLRKGNGSPLVLAPV